MVKLSSTEIYESKTVPGVKFSLRRVTESRRQAFNDSVAEPQAKYREHQMELEAIEGKPLAERDHKRVVALEALLDSLMYNTIYPTQVDQFLVSITEFEMDETTITRDNLREKGPQALWMEIIFKIRERSALGGAEIKNFELPSTLPTPVDGSVSTDTIV